MPAQPAAAQPGRPYESIHHLVEGYTLNVEHVIRVLEVARHAALGELSLPQIEGDLTEDDRDVVGSLLRSAVALLLLTASAMREKSRAGG